MNHILHVVNCNVDQVPNHFHKDGVLYLPYRFNEADPDLLLLDSNDKNISEVFSFIEEAREQGQSVLIHGHKEYTLPLVLFAAYLMLRYRWALSKSIQFLQRRIGPLPIKGALLSQLRSLESRYKNRIRNDLTTEWRILPGMGLEEVTIHNTYTNAIGMYKSQTGN